MDLHIIGSLIVRTVALMFGVIGIIAALYNRALSWILSRHPIQTPSMALEADGYPLSSSVSLLLISYPLYFIAAAVLLYLFSGHIAVLLTRGLRDPVQVPTKPVEPTGTSTDR